MATTDERVSIGAGELADEDDMNSIAGQTIQVFTNRAARNAANAMGLVWVSGRNELQLWNGSKWLTLAQAPAPPTGAVGVPRPEHAPARTDDATLLPDWHRKDHRQSIPAALSTRTTYPVKRLPNPFGFDPIPLQRVFDRSGMLEFGQTSAVSAGSVRQLTAQIDCEVHILLVGPGGPGTPSEDRNDLNFNGVEVYLAGGGGGGGELAETRIRIPEGESLYIEGLHDSSDYISVVYDNHVILNVAQGAFSPGSGAPQAEASGLAYNAAGNAKRVTPTVEPRYGYTARVGGLAYEPGPAKGEYGCAGTGATFLADGNLGRWRGQYGTTNNVPTLGPLGLNMPWIQTWDDFGHPVGADGSARGQYVGGAGHGFRTMYSTDTADVRAGYTTRIYGNGGFGGYSGKDVTRNPARWGPVAPGPGVCIIRYSRPGEPLPLWKLL